MLFLRCPKCGQGVPYEGKGDPSTLLKCPKCEVRFFLGDKKPEEGQSLPGGMGKEKLDEEIQALERIGSRQREESNMGLKPQMQKEEAPQEKLEPRKTKERWHPGCLTFIGVLLFMALVIGYFAGKDNYETPPKPLTLQRKTQPGSKDINRKAEIVGKYKIWESPDGEKVVSDTETNLTWVQNGSLCGKRINWEEAKEYCEDLYYCGYYDWRLPTTKELQTLIKIDESPTINNKVFTCEVDYYWSSDICRPGEFEDRSDLSPDIFRCWAVSFYKGHVNSQWAVWPLPYLTKYYVRPVR